MNKAGYMKRIKKYLPIFLITDFIFVFLLYIVAADRIFFLIAFIIVFTLLQMIYLFYLEYKSEQKRKILVKNFFKSPSFEKRDRLVAEFGSDWKNIINRAFFQMKEMEEKLDQKDKDLDSYREFIEEWTHEIKTPLSVSKLLLQNHKDEISPYVKDRLKYINTNIEKDIEKILYYARADATYKDYKIKKIKIEKILTTCLENYYPLIAEKGIIIREEVEDFTVFSDENVLVFIISQILDNAIKYTENKIIISSIEGEKFYRLEILNNGDKVEDRDAPFIFEKGFTGEISYNQKPTGMGLYLCKKYADDLGLDLKITTNEKGKFALGIDFPKIDEEG